MASARVFLGSIHHISEHSIFFLPLDSTHLDLRTLSTAPPCHRAALQRHGLIAKVVASVTPVEEAGEGGRLHTTRHPSPFEERLESCDGAYAPADREDLWRGALTYAGLLPAKDARLDVAEEMAAALWPVLSAAQYATVVAQATARARCTAVNTSPYCVPLLSVQAYVHTRGGLQVSLAVLWMPFLPTNLRRWALGCERAGERIAERSLIALAHHLTIAQLTLRSGTAMAGQQESAAAEGEPQPTLDCVLVHRAEEERGSRAGDSTEEPFFITSAPPLASGGGDGSSQDGLLSGAGGSKAVDRLYRPPEEEACQAELPFSPAAATRGSSKRSVWAIGVVLYLVASGRVAATAPQRQTPAVDGTALPSPRRSRAAEEAPLNSAGMTPDAVWRRIRRDLEPRGYHGTLTALVAQLLSLDPLTRPSLTTLDRLLQDLRRPSPILRFPFALGGYDLLRLPDPAACVGINPGARRYTFTGACVLCKRHRGAAASSSVCSRGGDHQCAGVTSPSWCDDEGELLPEVTVEGPGVYMTCLYPISGAKNARLRRRLAAHALQHPNASLSVVASGTGSGVLQPEVPPIDCGFLLQAFGGFAVYERVPAQDAKGRVMYKIHVREVLVPFPSHALRRSERPLVKTTLTFGAAMPWPSWCTETLQKSGRVSRNVPFALAGAHGDAEWFGWVLPGERFALPNGAHWTAPPDGALVLWCGADLQPTDRDRYYALTSGRAATLPATVHRTVLPDSLFRQHAGEECHASSVLMRSVPGSSTSTHAEAQGESSVRSPGASVVRRRSVQSVTDVALPSATHEIVEDDETGTAGAVATVGGGRPTPGQGLVSPRQSRLGSADRTASGSRSTRRRRSSATPSRRSLSCQVSVIDSHAETKRRGGADGVRSTAAVSSPSPQTRCEHNPAQKPASYERGHDGACTPPTAGGAATPLTCEQRMETAPSPVCSAPAAYGCISSREGTQPPSHRDTSARNVRALAPLSANEARPGAAKDAKKRKSRVMVAADPHAAAATQRQESPTAIDAGAQVEAAGATVVAAPQLSQLPPIAAAASAEAAPCGSPMTRHAPARLSRPPSRRPTSAGCGVNSGRRPSSNGFATPVFATPKQSPLTGGSSAMSLLRLCGSWMPADSVDAPFQALTFWVYATGEHGYMQSPVKLSPAMSYALRTPPGAVHLAFLSNQVPLFRRNHPRMDVAVVSPRLPHHGFVCYTADGALLGVLAMRIYTVDSDAATDVSCGEFGIEMHAREPRGGAQVAPRAVYASYLPGSVGDEQALLRKSEAPQHLLHSPSFTQAGIDSRTLCNASLEAQTLTFTSARRLIGEFTPHDKDDDFAAENTAPALLPACWVGFEAEPASLVFADVSQSMWVPYSIGDM